MLCLAFGHPHLWLLRRWSPGRLSKISKDGNKRSTRSFIEVWEEEQAPCLIIFHSVISLALPPPPFNVQSKLIRGVPVQSGLWPETSQLLIWNLQACCLGPVGLSTLSVLCPIAICVGSRGRLWIHRLLEIVDRPAYITPNSNKNQVEDVAVTSTLQLNTAVLKSGVDFAAVEYRGLPPVLGCCKRWLCSWPSGCWKSRPPESASHSLSLYSSHRRRAPPLPVAAEAASCLANHCA